MNVVNGENEPQSPDAFLGENDRKKATRESPPVIMETETQAGRHFPFPSPAVITQNEIHLSIRDARNCLRMTHEAGGSDSAVRRCKRFLR